jgi:hypothetical protein
MQAVREQFMIDGIARIGGPKGIGKTALMNHIAHTMLDEYLQSLGTLQETGPRGASGVLWIDCGQEPRAQYAEVVRRWQLPEKHGPYAAVTRRLLGSTAISLAIFDNVTDERTLPKRIIDGRDRNHLVLLAGESLTGPQTVELPPLSREERIAYFLGYAGYGGWGYPSEAVPAEVMAKAAQVVDHFQHDLPRIAQAGIRSSLAEMPAGIYDSPDMLESLNFSGMVGLVPVPQSGR